jgi:hypothetical protein
VNYVLETMPSIVERLEELSPYTRVNGCGRDTNNLAEKGTP